MKKDDLSAMLTKREELNKTFDITFFIPALNEERSIIKTLGKIIEVMKKINLTFELIVINDGSTDNTRILVENYMMHVTIPIRLVNNKVRRGLGHNYVSAAFLGLGEYYMMICGDNAETEESIINIISEKGKADIVIPYFGDWDARNRIRKTISHVFTFIINVISGNKIYYYNGTVLHLRDNVQRCHPMATGFAYQAELLDLLIADHKSYVEIKVANNDRDIGYSRAFYLQNFLSVAHSCLQIILRRIRRIIWPV